MTSYEYVSLHALKWNSMNIVNMSSKLFEPWDGRYAGSPESSDPRLDVLSPQFDSLYRNRSMRTLSS